MFPDLTRRHIRNKNQAGMRHEMKIKYIFQGSNKCALNLHDKSTNYINSNSLTSYHRVHTLSYHYLSPNIYMNGTCQKSDSDLRNGGC